MRHKIKSVFAALAVALSIIFPFNLAQADAGGRSGASPAGVEGSVQIKTGSALGYSDYFSYVIDDETLKVDSVASFSNLYITTGEQLEVTEPAYSIDIEGGTGGTTSGDGGAITIRGGGSYGASPGGVVTITGGDASETGDGGDVVLSGGAGAGGGTNGAVKIGADEVLTTASAVSVSQLNGGTDASSTTFWRGDGTWSAPAGGGSSLTGFTDAAAPRPQSTALGNNAGLDMTTGGYNTVIGASAGQKMATGQRNTAVGFGALYNASGPTLDNTAVGYNAGGNLSTAAATGNTLIGVHSGSAITVGADNTMIGGHAGKVVTMGSKNTYIGAFDGTGYATENGHVFISDGWGQLRFHANAGGNVEIYAGGSANKGMCWKADGKTLGYCSTALDAAGVCTCN